MKIAREARKTRVIRPATSNQLPQALQQQPRQRADQPSSQNRSQKSVQKSSNMKAGTPDQQKEPQTEPMNTKRALRPGTQYQISHSNAKPTPRSTKLEPKNNQRTLTSRQARPRTPDHHPRPPKQTSNVRFPLVLRTGIPIRDAVEPKFLVHSVRSTLLAFPAAPRAPTCCCSCDFLALVGVPAPGNFPGPVVCTSRSADA